MPALLTDPVQRIRVRFLAVAMLALAAAGCATAPESEPAPAAPEEDLSAFGQRADSAPVELEQFGRLAGRWECRVFERLGSQDWAPRSGSVVWTWFYTLGGHAVQDVWEPRAGSSRPFGTNLRIYDTERAAWKSVWTASNRSDFEYWQGAEAGGDIVMQTARDARPARIVFSAIGANTFEWRYERVVGADWQGVLRASCTRLGRLR